MNEWIPVKIRPMTEEEKAEYNCNDDVKIFDCPLPEDGQDVLVTTRYGDVQMDTFFTDEGSYFERYCDEGDVLAWMPIPEPYKEGTK